MKMAQTLDSALDEIMGTDPKVIPELDISPLSTLLFTDYELTESGIKKAHFLAEAYRIQRGYGSNAAVEMYITLASMVHDSESHGIEKEEAREKFLGIAEAYLLLNRSSGNLKGNDQQIEAGRDRLFEHASNLVQDLRKDKKYRNLISSTYEKIMGVINRVVVDSSESFYRPAHFYKSVHNFLILDGGSG